MDVNQVQFGHRKKRKSQEQEVKAMFGQHRKEMKMVCFKICAQLAAALRDLFSFCFSQTSDSPFAHRLFLPIVLACHV